MEDRYLFRAKRIDNGKWVQGNLIQSCDATDGWETIIIPITNSNMFTKHIKRGYGNLGFENWYRVDPSTICQCTGLKDKNSKLIWENDIVKYRVYQRTEQLYKVIYDYEEGSWSLGCNSEPLYSIGRANSEKCEVVGNAFDNPELLEVQE